jgi:hypothetical protein
MKTTAVLGTLGLGLGLAGECRAGFMTSAVVGGGSTYQAPDGSYKGISISGSDQGPTSSSAGGDSGLGAIGFASVRLSSTNPGIRLFAHGRSGNGVVVSETHVGASWDDVIRVSTGSASPPGRLRIVLQVDGVFRLERGAANTIYEGMGQFNLSAFGTSVASVSTSVQGAPYPDYFLTGGSLNNFQFDPTDGSISWETVLYVPYNGNGGYNLSLQAMADAVGYGGGSGTAGFGNTIWLTEVTLADGSALTGPVTFDSGFMLTPNVSPVPAPGGMVLAAVGGASLLGYRWRRHTPAAA